MVGMEKVGRIKYYMTTIHVDVMRLVMHLSDIDQYLLNVTYIVPALV